MSAETIAAATAPGLPDVLRRHVRERPGHTAVIDGASGESVTYAGLFAHVQALANGLEDSGITHGQRVGIAAPNSLGYVEVLWALAEIGAIAVPLNLRLAAPEAAANLTDAQATALIADDATLPAAEAIADAAGIATRLTLGAAQSGWTSMASMRDEADPTARSRALVTGATSCTLLFTSGTTGRAKGCDLPQRTWIGYAMNMAATGMNSDDVYLALLPYFHVAGLGTLLSQMILGGTVITQAAADPEQMYRLIDRHRASIVFVVPGITGPFIDHAPADQAAVASLRLVICAAGLDRPGLVEEVADKLGADCAAIYGQTESGTKITWATSAQLRAHPGAYGSVMPGIAYRIVDADDHDVPDNAPGELVIRAATVMHGYWGRPEATAETLRGGWHHTGDVFVHDNEGQLRMVDRTKYLIKTGGENVYPQEVENILREHPHVADVAVVGIPDPDWGETIKAFIVAATPDAPPSRVDLDRWVRGRIAGYKAPRFITYTDAIPRNESGKIVKTTLADEPTSEDQRVPRKGRDHE